MAIVLQQNPAPGGPGIPPRWARSDKAGIGTAYSGLSRVWYTLSRGTLNEICFPTIDRPQIRDFQFLVSDGESFFHDTRRHMTSTHEYLEPRALGFRVVSDEPEGRYRMIKEIISNPHQSCVLLNTRLEAKAEWLPKLRVYALLAPHLEVGGMGNHGNVLQMPHAQLLSAHKGVVWVVMGATVPFTRCSCGYVGVNDGWRDVSQHLKMTCAYDSAPDGNIALIGELDLSVQQEFVLGIAFGHSLHQALVTLSQSLGVSFAEQQQRFVEQWHRTHQGPLKGIEKLTSDGGKLVHVSHSLILAHEDKTFDGAMIASLSTPWGEVVSDDDLGGYHLVWTRDMYNSATGLLAAGSTSTPFRALIYLANAQCDDGGFYQNFWIDGEPYWKGIQLDEVSFPIILAWRLQQHGGLHDFDPWPMVRRAASYLIHHGPATMQERWEENSGYSPSTLAANIAGLICAAALARQRGHTVAATFLEEYADFLEAHIESWTVTTEGTLLPDVPRHYIRIHPMDLSDPWADEDANHGLLTIRNRPPDAQAVFPAKDVVDGGFLELVRYGIRKPGDPLMEDSLRVIDHCLKVDAPQGPCWKRYNHDGYGQRADGSAFQGWGKGHGWPLLTGERGHYELAAGRDPRPYLHAMERFATSTCLQPEQVWSLPDQLEAGMVFGQPTGGAMPLVWAHAEYLKLVRSIIDKQVFDCIPEVAARYLRDRKKKLLEVWKFNRQVRTMSASATLRVQVSAPFRLHWTNDDWKTTHDTASTDSQIDKHYVDLTVSRGQRAPLRFTFFWTGASRWEGKDYEVGIKDV